MDLAIFALILALLESFSPASTELQSLLIFTTATTDDQQLEELKLRWTKLGPSFESQFAGTLNGFDQRNFWTILLSRGEPDVLFADIEKAIQSDDRTKVIVGRPDGIIDRIFLSPFCWRKGITEQIAFVMCNGKLEFQIDDRGWEIDEKVETTEALRKTGDEKLAKAARSVWIDLFPGVRLATALPMQRRVKHHTEQLSKKKDQQEQQQKVAEENEGDDDEENKVGEKEEERKEEEEEDDDEVEDKKEEDSDENAESEEKEEADGNVEEEDDEEGDDGEDDNDEEEREDNAEDEDEKLRQMMDGQSEAEQKRLCRYRLSCYAKHQIRLPEKHRQERRNPLSGKMTPPKGVKMITLKEAASKAIKKVERQEAEGKALREQYSHDGEKVLADFWSELERKNKCKYRKSCYRTGVVPNIERSPLLQWMGGGSEGEDSDDEEGESGAKEVEKDFEAMDDYERKLFCRYRPSCYESGVRPRRSEKFLDFGEVGQNLKVWWSKLAERQHEKEEEEEKEQQTVGPVDAVDEHRLSKLECKYRRSCYETGELPVPLRKPKRDLASEHATKVLGGKKVPTSVKELKLFCKYRKSCYVASADSADKKKAAAERGSTIAAATAGHNETRAADKDQLPRKAKANSEPRNGGKLLAPEAVPNHGTEKKKKKAGGQENGKTNKKSKGNCDQEKPSAKSKAAKSRKDEEEEEKKQKVLPVRRKHRRRPAMELRTEVAKGKQGESSEKAQNERKRKKYTVEVPVDVENEEIEKEAEEEKPNEDHLVAKEKKTKTKRYTVEEAPREVPAKVWMKKGGSGGGGEDKEDVSEKEEESDGEDKVGKDDDDDEDSDEEEKEVEEKTAVKKGRKLSKLECRYRKSCYKSGVAPRRSESGDWGWQSDLGIRAFFANLMGEKPSEETQRSAADDEGEGHGHIEGWARMGEKERLFRCKYRKSCYQRMNAQAGRNDGSGRKWEEGKEKRPKGLEPMKMAQKQEAEKEGREKDQKEVEAKQPRAVDMRTKLRCKYRKSCYEESGRVGKVPKVMERMAERSGPAMGNGSAAVDAKCNPWRISCRQSLGLPIREKAPIGPSGKKLCRKRRKNGDRDEEDDSGRK